MHLRLLDELVGEVDSQMEMKWVYLLADLIAQNMISDSLQPDWNRDFKAIWPSSNPQDALDRALDARGYQRVLLTPQSTKHATWSMEEQSWYFCTAVETVGATESANIDR
jgi:hypothetical protein